MPEIIKSLLRSKNYSKGRQGHVPIDMIVIHVMEGSEDAANQWFEDESSHVSANYGIAKNGRIEMYVAEEDAAWAQGRVNNPTAKLVKSRPNINPNLYCVSIEHEGSGKEPLTPAQKVSSVWLIQDIARRHAIPIDRDHVVGHREIYSLKTCPGAISVDELVQLAQRPTRVYSEYFRDMLRITLYVSDTEWYFIPEKEFARGIRTDLRAQTPLSQMPLAPPV